MDYSCEDMGLLQNHEILVFFKQYDIKMFNTFGSLFKRSVIVLPCCDAHSLWRKPEQAVKFGYILPALPVRTANLKTSANWCVKDVTGQWCVKVETQATWQSIWLTTISTSSMNLKAGCSVNKPLCNAFTVVAWLSLCVMNTKCQMSKCHNLKKYTYSSLFFTEWCSSNVHHSVWLLPLYPDPVTSTVHGCIHIGTGLFPSTGTPSQKQRESLPDG